MSASSTPTVNPRAASATARFTVTDDLPTPPLPDAMASTRASAGTSVSGASSRAFQRARAMTAARSSASIAATSTRTEPTQSSAWTWLTTSFSIWLRSGQDAMVSAHLYGDVGSLDGDAAHHAQIHDRVAELGIHHRTQAVAHLVGAPAGRRAPSWGGRVGLLSHR